MTEILSSWTRNKLSLRVELNLKTKFCSLYRSDKKISLKRISFSLLRLHPQPVRFSAVSLAPHVQRRMLPVGLLVERLVSIQRQLCTPCRNSIPSTKRHPKWYWNLWHDPPILYESTMKPNDFDGNEFSSKKKFFFHIVSFDLLVDVAWSIVMHWI